MSTDAITVRIETHSLSECNKLRTTVRSNPCTTNTVAGGAARRAQASSEHLLLICVQ